MDLNLMNNAANQNYIYTPNDYFKLRPITPINDHDIISDLRDKKLLKFTQNHQ